MIFATLAIMAESMDIRCLNDEEIFKQEALKYAKMYGDFFIHLYNTLPNF